MDDLDKENLSLAVNRIGAVAGILFLLNAPLSIYLREAPQAAVVGVPDAISLFGIPVKLREVGLAVIVSIFIQWSLVRNLVFVRTMIDDPNFDLDVGKRMITQRATLLNPFFCLRSFAGTVFSLLSLAGFAIAAFLIDAQLLLTVFSQRIGDGIFSWVVVVLIALTWMPIPIIAAWTIHRIDQKLSGRRYAIFRSITFALALVLLIVSMDFA